jgi:hypothetical protein
MAPGGKRSFASESYLYSVTISVWQMTFFLMDAGDTRDASRATGELRYPPSRSFLQYSFSLRTQWTLNGFAGASLTWIRSRAESRGVKLMVPWARGRGWALQYDSHTAQFVVSNMTERQTCLGNYCTVSCSFHKKNRNENVTIQTSVYAGRRTPKVCSCRFPNRTESYDIVDRSPSTYLAEALGRRTCRHHLWEMHNSLLCWRKIFQSGQNLQLLILSDILLTTTNGLSTKWVRAYHGNAAKNCEQSEVEGTHCSMGASRIVRGLNAKDEMKSLTRGLKGANLEGVKTR